MNVLIVNVHSALNLGDDAIMRATLGGLRAVAAGSRVTVAANDPTSWHRYDDVTVLGSFTTWVETLREGRFRGRLWQMPEYAFLLAISAIFYRLTGRRLEFGARGQRDLLSAYYEADLVLSCGGGNFYANRTLSPFLVWALAALAFPLVLGKPVIMLPQSIGPIPGYFQRLLAKMVFASVRTLLVRERASETFLTGELGLKRPIAVAPDLAFSLASLAAARPTNGTQPERIGVTVIDYQAQGVGGFDQSAYERTLVLLLERLAESRGATIEIFCQAYGPSADQDDRAAARRLHDQLKDRCPRVALREWVDDSRTIMDSYAELDLIIGTRMHTGIFALGRGVPALLIGYQPKSAGTMALLGLERYSLDIRKVDGPSMYLLATELLDDTGAVREQIPIRVARLREEAARWTSWLDDLR